MDEHHIVRSMLLRIGRGQSASAPIAKAIVEWAQPHVGWLLDCAPDPAVEPGWEDLIDGLARTTAPVAAHPSVADQQVLNRSPLGVPEV